MVNLRISRIGQSFLHCVTLSSIFFLSSCGTCGWEYREVVTDYIDYNSAQLTHLIQEEFSGIEVQFLKGEFGVITYLNVMCRTIPPFNDHPSEALVVLEIDGEKTPIVATRMEGGQRVRLPDEMGWKMLDALDADQTVKVYLDGFGTELCNSGFKYNYKKFKTLPQ